MLAQTHKGCFEITKKNHRHQNIIRNYCTVSQKCQKSGHSGSFADVTEPKWRRFPFKQQPNRILERCHRPIRIQEEAGQREAGGAALGCCGIVKLGSGSCQADLLSLCSCLPPTAAPDSRSDARDREVAPGGGAGGQPAGSGQARLC